MHIVSKKTLEELLHKDHFKQIDKDFIHKCQNITNNNTFNRPDEYHCRVGIIFELEFDINTSTTSNDWPMAEMFVHKIFDTYLCGTVKSPFSDDTYDMNTCYKFGYSATIHPDSRVISFLFCGYALPSILSDFKNIHRNKFKEISPYISYIVARKLIPLQRVWKRYYWNPNNIGGKRIIKTLNEIN